MRDALYITGLLAAFVLLALDFPSLPVEGRGDSPRRPFASFVELSPSVHAACLESARTSWQVRSGSRGSLSIGSLDSGIPLLADAVPSRDYVEFREIKTAVLPVGQVDVGEYSLLPATEGADNPRFWTRPVPAKDKDSARKDDQKPFSKEEMISVDALRKIKEIMQ